MLGCSADPAADRLHGPAGDEPVTLQSPAPLIFPQNFVNPSATMFRRDVAERVGGYVDAVGGSDMHYVMRVLEHGTGLVSPEVGALYHVHDGQVTVNRVREVEQSVRTLVASFESRPWYRPELLESLRVAHAWDDLRRSLGEGDRARVRANAGWIARRPRRVRALAELWRWRLALRRRSARTGRDGRATVAVLRDDAVDPAAVSRASQLGAVVDLSGVGGRRRAAVRLLRRPTRHAVARSRWDRVWLRAVGVRPVRP